MSGTGGRLVRACVPATGGHAGSGGGAGSGNLFALTGRYGFSGLVDVGGDVDGDGNLDLVAVGTPGSGDVSVWKGHGDGTFEITPVVSHLGFAATNPYFGDFDGDGHADIAAAGTSFSPAPGTFAINVAKGQSDGAYGYGSPKLYPSLLMPHICGTYETSAGTTDFVVAGATNTTTKYLDLRGVTNPGTLLGAGASAGVVGCSILSFDGIGSPLVRVSITQQSSLGTPMSSVLFVNATPILGFADLASAWIIADLDRDGYLDIGAAQTGDPSTRAIFWGGATAPFSTSTPLDGYAQTTGDFDADGNMDVLTCNGQPTCAILFGDGARHFGRPRPVPGGNVVDINNDCVPDLVSAHLLMATQTSPVVLSVYVSTAGRAPSGYPDIECGPISVDQCVGPTGF